MFVVVLLSFWALFELGLVSQVFVLMFGVRGL